MKLNDNFDNFPIKHNNIVILEFNEDDNYDVMTKILMNCV